MPHDRKINSTAACISFMLQGCEMKKVRSNSRMYSRFFLLAPDMRCLRWEPSKKDSEKAKIEIELVKEVRVGKKTPVLRSNGLSDQFPDECAFSIIHGDNYESLDLVASSADVVNAWVMGLRYLVSYGKHTPEAPEAGHPSLRTSWISSVFKVADLEKVGRIPVARAVQLIKALNPGMKDSTIELKFKELQKAGEQPGSDVACDLFVEAYVDLCTRPEIFFLLVQFSSDKESLGLKDLLTFLEVEQGMEGVTEETCLEIVGKYEPSSEGREKGYLAIDGFTRYLLSPDCSIFDPQHRRVCQDMTQPLSHYFISSAHSACLREDSSWGSAGLGGYVTALRMGCRSLELVVWDGPDGEPLVSGGRSAASRVACRSVVGVIDRYAFEASEYPLILCLAVRCSPAQQRLMAQCLRKTLGAKLYLDPPAPEEAYLPSPETLKARVLIKGRKLPPSCHESEGEVTDEDEGPEPWQRPVTADGQPLAGGGRRRLRLSRELSELVSLCQAVPFQDFEASRHGQRYWEVCSFSEVEAGRFASECPAELVSYNKRFLSRVYPSPLRIDASNMNPQDFWKCGCQMVAMNFQTPGLMMDLNAGWFRQNGACGYVLRPAVMREEVSYFSANAKDSLPGVPAQLLQLRVISGQNLPKPRGSGAKGDVVEPYVCAEIHGIPADCAEQRTKTALQSGDNPVFEESLEFQVNLPELALLRLVVLDDDYIGDEFIAQYTIPFECLQSGYRHVPLRSLAGDLLPHATLFLHVAIANRPGGGKGPRRGRAGRRGRRLREYASAKTTGIKAIDEVFRTASQPLREATDLRENMQRRPWYSFKGAACGIPSPSGSVTAVPVPGGRGGQFCRRLPGSSLSTGLGTGAALAAPSPTGARGHSLLPGTEGARKQPEAAGSGVGGQRVCEKGSCWGRCTLSPPTQSPPQQHGLGRPHWASGTICPAKGSDQAWCHPWGDSSLSGSALELARPPAPWGTGPPATIPWCCHCSSWQSEPGSPTCTPSLPAGCCPPHAHGNLLLLPAGVVTAATWALRLAGITPVPAFGPTEPGVGRPWALGLLRLALWLHRCPRGMDFHKELHRLEAKEGLKGRKLQKALESFAWNITVLKGQADLLKQAKAEALDNLWQIHNAGQSCGIGRNGSASPDLGRARTPLEPISETEGGSDTGSC
ncbi:inactive phospholipase C-like protein 2 [Chelonoidis abingdonii]|uniref:inactive phospholipase C-like protein 2 n=1 Tax=Chelonoidis abingdonii TaxID=106734 RepID=UPI003F495BF5